MKLEDTSAEKTLQDYVVFNGRLMRREEVCIAPDDRGWKYGDGAFETIRIISGKPYLLAEHLERLRSGLRAIRIHYDISQLQPDIEKLLRSLKARSAMLRITVSRGAGGEGYRLPLVCAPSILIECTPFTPEVSPVRLITSQYRRIPPACLPSSSKLSQGMNSILAREEAAARGFDEALQLSIHGHIACASSANIFWRRHGRIFTPALSTGCLAGVTRRRIMELSKEPVYEVEEPDVTIRSADAVMLSNSRYLARAAEQVDDTFFTSYCSAEWADQWRRTLEYDAC